MVTCESSETTELLTFSFWSENPWSLGTVERLVWPICWRWQGSEPWGIGKDRMFGGRRFRRHRTPCRVCFPERAYRYHFLYQSITINFNSRTLSSSPSQDEARCPPRLRRPHRRHQCHRHRWCAPEAVSHCRRGRFRTLLKPPDSSLKSIFQHAAQVLEAVKDTQIVTSPVARVKRDWFATMSPQEVSSLSSDKTLIKMCSVQWHGGAPLDVNQASSRQTVSQPAKWSSGSSDSDAHSSNCAPPLNERKF